MGNDIETLGKVDAMAVGFAVLQAVLHLKRGEEAEVDLNCQGITLRIAAHPASNRVVVLEV